MDRSHQSAESVAGRPRDYAIRRAGLFLLLTATATVAMVYARVSADADQPTLLESMHAIAANKGWYNAAAIARLLSGLTLVAGASFLWKTWIVRERFGTPAVPYLLAASGAATAASGICALLLAVAAPGALEVAALNAVDSSTEAVALLRWVTGKLGFGAAGLALLAAAHRQWKAGGLIRRIAPASALIGIGMQLIWVDSATIMHRITGVAFVVWIVAIGVMLLTGMVERHFSMMRESS